MIIMFSRTFSLARKSPLRDEYVLMPRGGGRGEEGGKVDEKSNCPLH